MNKIIATTHLRYNRIKIRINLTNLRVKMRKEPLNFSIKKLSILMNLSSHFRVISMRTRKLWKMTCFHKATPKCLIIPQYEISCTSNRWLKEWQWIKRKMASSKQCKCQLTIPSTSLKVFKILSWEVVSAVWSKEIVRWVKLQTTKKPRWKWFCQNLEQKVGIKWYKSIVLRIH